MTDYGLLGVIICLMIGAGFCGAAIVQISWENKIARGEYVKRDTTAVAERRD